MNQTSNTLNRVVRGLLALTLLVGAVAVAPTAALAQSKKKIKGKDLGKLPFDNKRTDRRYFRAVGLGSSTDQNISERMAIQRAQVKIAEQIQATVKSVTEDYVQQLQADDKASIQAKFEQLSRVAVNQTLAGLTFVEKEVRYRKTDKKDAPILDTYVLMELDRDALLDAMDDQVSRDDRARVNYDRKKFEEVFDGEMGRLEAESAQGEQSY